MLYGAIRQRPIVCLGFIVVAALLLRLWGISYGLPYLYINDEYHEVMRAMELGAGSYNFDRVGKGGLYLLLFVEYGFYFVFLKLTGVIGSATDFALGFARDPSAFYLMGRVTTALFGIANVVLVYLLARRIFSRGAGIIAAVFLAANALHIELSHTVNVDVVMTCFATAALLFAVRIIEHGAKKDYLLAATFAALATTTKLPGVLLVVPLLIAHVSRVLAQGARPSEAIKDSKLWGAGALFAAVLFGTDPGLLINLGTVASMHVGLAGEDLAEEEFIAGSLEAPNLFLYYLDAIKNAMGWPLAFVSAVGIVHAVWRRTTFDILILSYLALHYLAIAATPTDFYYSRYILPLLPLLAILAGRTLDELFEKFAQIAQRRQVALIAAFVALLAAGPTFQGAKESYLMTRTDSRTLAKQWIDANVPEGARVFIEGAKIAPVRTSVPLQDTPEKTRERIEYWSVEEPRQAQFLEFKLAVLEGKGFDLELVPLDDLEPLQTYVDEGIEYFVIIPVRFLQHRRSGSISRQLVEDLRTRSDVELIWKIEEDRDRRRGPAVEVYRYTGGASLEIESRSG